MNAVAVGLGLLALLLGAVYLLGEYRALKKEADRVSRRAVKQMEKRGKPIETPEQRQASARDELDRRGRLRDDERA